MISIFNSTTDYKGGVTTNCEKIQKKDGISCSEHSIVTTKTFRRTGYPRTIVSERLSVF